MRRTSWVGAVANGAVVSEIKERAAPCPAPLDRRTSPADSRHERARLPRGAHGIAPALPRPVYLRGERITRFDAASYFGWVAEGLIAVVRTDVRGHEAIVELRGAGATLGEDSLAPHPMVDDHLAFEALVPTRVHWVDPTSAAASADRVARAVMAVMATRIRQQHEAACRQRLQSLSQKVADQLVDLSTETVLGGADTALHHVSRFDLARIVGTNRSVVSRICGDFERRGWCRLSGRTISNLDEASMTAHAARHLAPMRHTLRQRLLQHQAALIALVSPLRA